MNLATARNISIIILAIEAIILVLIPLVMFYFMNKGLRQGTLWLKKTGLPQAQKYTRLAADKTNEYSGKITDPIIKVEKSTTQVKETVGTVSKSLRRRN